MAMPLPDKPNATTANLDAWKKVTGATNEGVAIVEKPKPPSITGVVRQREDSPVPEIGSDGFTAADARKSASKITEEYTLEELTDIVDNTMRYIRAEAEDGEVAAGIDTKPFNNGLRKALIRELKHRGFKVTEEKADGIGVLGLNVSWEPIDWRKLCKALIGPLILVLVIAGLVTIGKLAMTHMNEHRPAAIEQPLERGK
jgi:hypothetical protein